MTRRNVGPAPADDRQSIERRRSLADGFRLILRRLEDLGEPVHFSGDLSAPRTIELLLVENARHQTIAEGWLRHLGYAWDGQRVVRAGGAGPRGEGGKRALLRLDVERVLRRLNLEDGLPPGAKRNNRGVRDRIRAVLSWTRDPSDLTDARLKATLKNVGDWGMADNPPAPPPPATPPRRGRG